MPFPGGRAVEEQQGRVFTQIGKFQLGSATPEVRVAWGQSGKYNMARVSAERICEVVNSGHIFLPVCIALDFSKWNLKMSMKKHWRDIFLDNMYNTDEGLGSLHPPPPFLIVSDATLASPVRKECTFWSPGHPYGTAKGNRTFTMFCSIMFQPCYPSVHRTRSSLAPCVMPSCSMYGALGDTFLAWFGAHPRMLFRSHT